MLVPIGFALQSVCASVRYLATRSTEPMFGEAGPEAPLSRPEGCVVTLLERPNVPVPLLKREPIRILFCNQEFSLRRPTTSLEAGTRGMAREKAIVVLGATGNQGSCVLKHLHAAETPNVGRVDESVLCWLRGRICPLLVTI